VVIFLLILYDLNKTKIAGLKSYKDLRIERELSGDEVLFFTYPQIDSKHYSIKEETYVRTKKNEYVIKEINIKDDWTEFVGKVNVEDLKGKAVNSFETVEQTCTNAVNLAIAGTGWTIGSCDVSKKRTVRKTNCSSYDILQEIKKVYLCDFKFDAINKKIYIYQSMGNDKGSYFSDKLNLKKLEIQSNSYDFCTRIIPIGKDGLKINNINSGKEYVENYQYSNKVITVFWEDNRYTVVENLKEDAAAKLNELSKPIRAYSAEIFDLANLNDKYKNIMDYDLGDTITLLSKDKKVKEKQRIVKIIEYPDEPERNSCDIANRTLSFEDIQADTLEAAETINSVTTSDGMIDNSKVNFNPLRLEVVSLVAEKANIGELNAAVARIGTLEATKATITQLHAVNAIIDNLLVDKANITDLTATNAKITNLEADTANINNLLAEKATIQDLTATNATISNLVATTATIVDLNAVKATIGILQADKANITDLTATNARITNLEADSASITNLLAGNIGVDNLQANLITAESGLIANGAIKDAMIQNLSVSKILSGNISTNKFVVTSDSGNLKIQGNTLKVWDTTGKERVSLGLNGSDYNLLIRGKDGNTVLFGVDGITNAGITEGAVDDSKIAIDANISGGKIEKESLVTRINGATTTLKASKIKFDDINQTLDVAFTSLKSTVTSNKETLTFQGTSISAIQGQIQAKIWQQDITSATNGLDTRISATETSITATNSAINLKVNTSTYTTKMTNIDGSIGTLTNNINSATSAISVLQNQINLKVEQSDITTAINGIESGGINLLVQKSIVRGKYLNNAGNAVNEANWFYTDYIPVSGMKNLTTSGYSNLGSAPAVCYYDSNKNFIKGINNNNQEKAKLITIDSGVAYIRFSGMIRDLGTLKIEKGTKATSYSPSPEDVTDYADTQISTAKAEIKITTDSIVQSVSNVNTSISSLGTRVASTESNISVLQGQISLKVEQSDIENAISSAQQGQNLIPDGSFENGGLGWGNGGTIVTDGHSGSKSLRFTSAGGRSLKKSIIVTPGNKYRISFWYKTSSNNDGNGDNQKLRIGRKSDGSHLVSVSAATNSTAWVQKTYTWTVPSDVDEIILSANTNLTTGWIQYDDISFVDITEIDGMTTRISTAESTINQLSSSIALKVETSTYNSKMSNLDSSISSLTTRINSAELKITDSAIVATVRSSSSYTSDLNKKADTTTVASTYATKSELTLTDNRLTLKFDEIGGSNLIRNSMCANNLAFWRNYMSIGSTSTKGAIYGKCFRVENEGTTAAHYGYSYRFNLKSNTQYTLSGWYRLDSSTSTGIRIYILQSNDSGLSETSSSYTEASRAVLYQGSSTGWQYVKHTFITGTDVVNGCIRADNMGATVSGSNGYVYFVGLKLEEGSVATAWSPNTEEVYGGITTIDKDGVKIAHSNKSNTSYSHISADGFYRYDGSTGREYHYLLASGVATISESSDALIQLPDEFKGKKFEVLVSIKSAKAASNASIELFNVGAGSKNVTAATFKILGYMSSNYNPTLNKYTSYISGSWLLNDNTNLTSYPSFKGSMEVSWIAVA
jgi:phage minor structural protein